MDEFIVVARITFWLAAYIVFVYVVIAAVHIAVLFSAVFAVKNYIVAVLDNINFNEWSWERDSEPARRSYFFGPGYIQLRETFLDSFSNNTDSAEWFHDVTDDYTDGGRFEGNLKIMVSILAYAFRFAGIVSIYVLGTAFTVFVAGIQALITTAVMICIYIVYSIVWLIDTGYLAFRQIRPICSNCKERFLVPSFVCPGCGAVHEHLIPGPYGILHHTCLCGMRLPATFLNGRSSLESRCPMCNTKLASSDTVPFIIQMAGGTSVGKTVYVAALSHWLVQVLKNNAGVNWEIPQDFVPYYEELERYYSGEVSDTSVCVNSQLYPMVITTQNNRKYMFSIFDIAGEMFDESTSATVIQQKQFQYCDGFLLILDPFCNGSSLNSLDTENKGFYSEMDFEMVVNAFINYLLEITRTTVGNKIRSSLSVIIAKCDVAEVSERLSEDVVTDLMEIPGNENMTRDEARDQVCRQFIRSIGFFNEVDILEQTFSSIHYFPVSAMGHKQDGTTFRPYGVVEPVRWIMEKENHDLLSIFG